MRGACGWWVSEVHWKVPLLVIAFGLRGKDTPMRTSKGLNVEVALAALLLTFGVTARAQAQTASPTPPPTVTATATPTPTNTPATCNGANKVQFTWFAKSPSTAKLNVSAAHCGAPPGCATVLSGTVTVPPITVTVSDSNGHSFGMTIADAGVNTRGCPGIDQYTPEGGRLRFVYGAKTTVIGKVPVALAAPTLPALTPPVTLTIRDSGSYTLIRTMNTCFNKQVRTTASIKCF